MTDIRDRLQAALDGYSIQRELAGGGMSRVFVARDDTLGRDVVIKVIAQEGEELSADRFAREVKVAARLQQANIVPVLSAGTAAGLPYYTMPFVRGESLRARLTNGPAPAVGEAVSILRDVARALAYAHAEGVVHRDIKPENILLSGGAAVVTDFGIAKAIAASRTQDGAAYTTITRAGASLGTPAYMAPEQALGEPGVDQRADLYAWGVMAYELLAGVHPFAGRSTIQALVAAHLTETPPPLAATRPDAPPSLSNMVMRCLEKSPDRRPAGAADVLSVMESVNTSADVVQPPNGRRGRRAALLGGAAAVVVALAAVIIAPRIRGAAPSLADKSLAVLPFTAQGNDTADTYLAEGIAEEVTNTLSQAPGVRLAGRSSARHAVDRTASPQEAGAALHVAEVLDGSVRRYGNMIHVAAELSTTSDGLVVWHEEYERPATDVFAVQGDIARAIAGRLQVTLGGTGSPSLAASGTKDATAYDLYLKGLYLYRRRGPGIPQAISTLEEATARDTSFARAWAALSNALTVSTSYIDVHAADVLPRARAAGQRAVRLDSMLADGHLALGYVYAEQFEWKAAESELRRAVALDPTDAEPLYRLGYSLSNQGRVSDAIPVLRRAVALDPLYFLPPTYLGWAEARGGRIAEGIADTRRGLALEPRSISVACILASVYDLAHMPDSARQYARLILTISS
ncbi:MAG TPA: protein kinase, partial [Gemmatimonadaceae bacterium]